MLDSAVAIEAELKRFTRLGSVLYIAAHPDDENTQLITYLARGRGYRTAYLSLTRGDGGQNVLSADLGEKLGVARTQELLAARRIDGGQQFFTRALDFGFSKDYQDTLSIWGREEVLSDVVRVIRQFQPDVIVTRFSPEPGGTHGHHTASAVLALEAFKLAGDPSAFPEQLRDLKPWQPKRVFWNIWRGAGGENVIEIDVAGTDPVHQTSFIDLAVRSRSQHKTQGFDNLPYPAAQGPRTETFRLLAGEPAGDDIMDGVVTDWRRYDGGEEIAQLAERIAADFSGTNPAASVPQLLELRAQLAKLPSDPVINAKRAQLDRVLQGCLGLKIKSVVPVAEVVAGESITVTHSAQLHADLPVRWRETRYGKAANSLAIDRELGKSAAVTIESVLEIPADAPLSQPYWLREAPSTGLSAVPDPKLIGRPDSPPVIEVTHVFEIGGQRLELQDTILSSSSADEPWEKRRELGVIAPVSISIPSPVEVFAPGESREVEIELTAARAGVSGDVALSAPSGWQVSAPKAFHLATAGGRQTVAFAITAPKQTSSSVFEVSAKVGDRSYRAERVEITYPHIPLQILQSPAQLKVVSVEVAKRGTRIGYIPGAGDTIPESLRQIGYEVISLVGSEVTAENLRELDAVVLGVRALNTRTDLNDRMDVLFDYVAKGGTVVLQYTIGSGLKVNRIAPLSMDLSRHRVTDEKAEVTFLVPDHAILNTPNQITQADFAGWVQERGLYFADKWDEGFVPLFAMNDRGEPPREGSLLVAKHGNGHFVYTGLSFFRQLPAGVPGAYRVFANLVSLGNDT